MKILVVVALLAILASLGSGLVYLVRDQRGSDRLLRALTWRIGLSVGLFALLVIGAWLGWIEPGNL